MLLHWTGTASSLFAQPPLEAVIEPVLTPESLAVAIEELEQIRLGFAALAQRGEVRHTLVAKFTSSPEFIDWIPKPSGVGAAPCTGWRIWALTFAPRLNDGAIGLVGDFELRGGAQGDLDRFVRLSTRAVLLTERLQAIARELDEDHLLATWMLDLYRSAESRLGTLRAPRRVRVCKLETSYEHLVELQAREPRGRIEGEIHAAIKACGGKVPCWAARLEPEVCTACVSKLGALILRLSWFARRAEETESRDETEAASSAALRDRASDGSAEEDQVPVPEALLLVLRKLEQSSSPLTTIEIGVRISRSRHAAGIRVTELIELGYANRPLGPKSGAYITPAGRDALRVNAMADGRS